MSTPTTDTAALTAYRDGKRPWHEIEPKAAVNIKLPRADIWGPITEAGRECPWPWEPQQLVGVPLGQYHCGYCGSMQVAGQPHLDYIGSDEAYLREFQ